MKIHRAVPRLLIGAAILLTTGCVGTFQSVLGVSGRVVDFKGVPVSNAKVIIIQQMPADFDAKPLITGPDGTFNRPSKYRLGFYPPGLDTIPFEATIHAESGYLHSEPRKIFAMPDFHILGIGKDRTFETGDIRLP